MDINTGVVEGKFPRRALSAVLEWYALYKDQLLEDWQLAERHMKLKKNSASGVNTMLEVVKARYEQGYKIWVEFNDGTSGIVDLGDVLWGPMFEPLKDVERFKRFVISDVLHTITWENDADIAPEYLYEKLAGQRMQRVSLQG